MIQAVACQGLFDMAGTALEKAAAGQQQQDDSVPPTAAQAGWAAKLSSTIDHCVAGTQP
jgi:hypothetical protein